MPICENYILAHSLTEALQSIKNSPGPARYIAGGTDLLLDLFQKRVPPVHTLVDVTEVEELIQLEIQQEYLIIGAAVPLVRLVTSPLVKEHALALNQACGLVGGPQVRNTATLGGNVAHALPAADGSIALLALNAQVILADLQGRRTLPIESMFLGPGESLLSETKELLVGFRIPVRSAGEASAFKRIMRPQGVALPILNLAVWLKRAGDQIIDIRVAIGPASSVPFRAREVEVFLQGKPFTEAAVSNGKEVLKASAHFRTSPLRASAAYREHLAQLLFRDVLLSAWDGARE